MKKFKKIVDCVRVVDSDSPNKPVAIYDVEKYGESDVFLIFDHKDGTTIFNKSKVISVSFSEKLGEVL